MPKKINVYDKGGKEPAQKDADGNVTREARTVEPGVIEMFAVDAHEAVRNDPARYRLSPWKGQVGSKGARAAAEDDEDAPRVGPQTSRTTSGPVKAAPVGREDTGAREPENPDQDKADAATPTRTTSRTK